MEKKIHIFLAGDSTVSDCPPGQEPRAGWGQVLPLFFTEEVAVYNEAVGGRSSNSFREEGRLEPILERIGAGDYLFIQFGHNDQKPIGTEPVEEFPASLLHYIAGAREKSAIPVLITPMHRRTFDESGRIANSLGEYPRSMIRLAKEKSVPLIDLWEESRKVYEKMGPEEAKKLFLWYEPGEEANYPDGIQDDTHFSREGALILARIITEKLKDEVPGLIPYLKLDERGLNNESGNTGT